MTWLTKPHHQQTDTHSCTVSNSSALLVDFSRAVGLAHTIILVPTPSTFFILEHHHSVTAQECKLNSVGAIVHPYLKPLLTLPSNNSPSNWIWAVMFSLTMLINISFSSTFQRASWGTESYAFLKSANAKNCFTQCSTAFSDNCRMVNIISLL